MKKMKTHTLFLLVESVAYALFLTCDFLSYNPALSDGIKYATVVLCFFYGVQKKDPLFLAAQGLVLFSDFFLLFQEANAWLGILGFWGVQICYAYLVDKSTSWIVLLLASGLFIGLLGSGYLAFTALVYGLLSLWNLVQAFRRHQPLGWVILLLACCDSCVALRYGRLGLPLTSFLMWAFYLPSQVLFTEIGTGGGLIKGLK